MINSFDEWSPLKEVIVGSPISYEAHEMELSFKLFFHDVANLGFGYPTYEAASDKNGSNQETTTRKLRTRYVEELTEDVEGLATALQKAGVKVLRPTILKDVPKFKTPYWSATGIPALNIRDQAIIMGNEIIETSPQMRARYFENDLLKPIFYKYFKEGCKWTSMPRPIMTDASFDTSYVSGEDTPVIEQVYSENKSESDIGFEMMIDAAQCLRFGKDILVNVSTANHELGLQWFEQHFGGKFNFHKMYRFSDSHIDSLILPLRPGLLLLRNPSIREKLPEKLKKWDVIYAPEPTENIFPQYEDDDLLLTTKYIDLNVLSVDENTVVANSLFPELIKTLESHGFNVIPVQHRHRRLFGGGFHCFTLDTVREGSCSESYI